MKGCIEKFSQILLVAESQIICEINGGIVEAMLGFMAASYVLMFRYPPFLNNFGIFMQKRVLKINDGMKLPASVIPFSSKLEDFK